MSAHEITYEASPHVRGQRASVRAVCKCGQSVGDWHQIDEYAVGTATRDAESDARKHVIEVETHSGLPFEESGDDR